MLVAFTSNHLDQITNRCQMLQVPVEAGQMLNYHYFFTDKQNFSFEILIYTFQLCLDVSAVSYPS